MRIEQQLTIPASIDRVWDFLMDVPAMAKCLPGVQEVTQSTEDTYNARIRQKVGPIAVEFDCQVTIVSRDKETYSATAQVSGRDGKIGAGMTGTMAMHLEPHEGNAIFTVTADTDISGKIAQYGHGIIRQRATAMLTAFGQCVTNNVA